MISAVEEQNMAEKKDVRMTFGTRFAFLPGVLRDGFSSVGNQSSPSIGPNRPTVFFSSVQSFPESKRSRSMSSYVRGSFARRVACAALGLAALLVAAPSRAEVVFGNLNSDNSRNLGSTNTDLGGQIVDDVNWLAQGFNTGAATLLDLQSITVGLFGTNVSTIPLTVSIYADSAGNPAATPLFTSAVTQVGTTDKYTFSFTGASLSANTTYWVVPNGGSWYYNAGTPPAPIAHNASGYTYVGGRESLSTGVTPASSVWDVGGNNRYSVSITAVPEPSTLTLAGIGLAMVVGLEVRRRRRQVELV
jgi:MYXO-CTERM domain-containing protein